MTEGGRSFAVTTCQLWNSLSLELRNSVSLESFRNNFRKNLFCCTKEASPFYSLTFDSLFALKPCFIFYLQLVIKFMSGLNS